MKKIYISLFILCFACKNEGKLTAEKKLLMQIVFSEIFAEKFRICDRIANDIAIYNNTGRFKEFNFSKDNYCDKKLMFNEIEFIYNANSLKSKHSGIVLLNFQQESVHTTFSFLQLQTNYMVRFTYNYEGNLLKVTAGYF